MNVNYKSDFKLFERGCDFTVPFTFEYRTVFGREYVASHIDGSYTNCSLQSDGRLMICFDNHNLSPGILTCTRHFYLTDRDFHNGICNLWDKRDTGIVLTIGKTDNCEIEVEVPPFYNQSKGDPGITPHIGENYNWWIGEEDTGVLAKGQNGATPSIGDNGNWWINGVDTGKPSRGVQGEKGNKGDKGDAGERGEQGQQGIQGPKGDEGDEGKTPVFDIGTITTLNAGEQATVSLNPNGTDLSGNPKYKLNFGIPKGEKGANGKDGIDGTNGKTPIFEIGQVNTLSPNSIATASLINDGTDLQGNPKYKLNLGIPKGEKGTSEEVDNITLSSLSDLNNSWEKLLKSEPNFATTSSNVASATKLQTVRSIWGKSFDGTKSIDGDLDEVGNISMNGSISGLKSLTGGNSTLSIDSSPGYNIGFRLGGSQQNAFCLINGAVQPYQDSSGILDLGSSTARWKTIYALNALNTSSDIRLKDICSYIDIEICKIAKAKIFSFQWKNKKIKDMQIGCSAQYWKDIVPEAVKEDSEGFLSMTYDRIALASAISVAREVVNMNKRIDDIERKMNEQNN